MDKKFFYEKEIRAELAAFNPYLKKDMENIRKDLGIPIDGFSTSEEADRWYGEHYQEAKGEPRKPKNPWNWHLPKEIVEMLDSSSYSNEPSKVNFDPRVPLDAHVMELIHAYGLPEQMVDSLKGYVLKEKHNAPAVPSALQPMFIPIDEGEEGTKYVAIVAGLDESTTKEQWLDVWYSFRQILRYSGKDEAPNRRPSDELLLRDLTWWNCVKKNGKTVRDALEEWLKKHPEDTDKLNEDTVRKAVMKVDRLMKPCNQAQTSPRLVR